MQFASRKQALAVVKGLSEPSKMPCYGYSLPRSACKMGMLMATANPNGICGKCYAKSGNYTYPQMKKSLESRLHSLSDPNWVDAMVYLIKRDTYFRWHDSGDLQSVNHLKMIAEVAKRTPATMHWLPTREYQIVKKYIEEMRSIARKRKKAFRKFIPENLVIRLSSSTFEGRPPVALAKQLGVQVSSVSAESSNCPASMQENKCGNCRKCWDKQVFEVSYKRHRSGTKSKKLAA